MLGAMYCQACGAENTADARFCNQCGAAIARPGESGGPLAGAPEKTQLGGHGAGSTVKDPMTQVPVTTGGLPGSGSLGPTPFGGPSMMGVSLAGVGIQSSKRAWGTVLGVALALLVVGGIAGAALSGGEEPSPEAGHADADDPMVVGAPELPTGVAPPTVEEDAPATSSMRTTAMRTTAMRTTGASAGTMSSGSSTMGSSTMGSTGTGTGSTGTGSTGTGSAGTGSSGSGSAGTGSGTGMGMGTGTGSSGDSSPEERDIEMELYAGRVRYAIRRYYQARAQTCFDRATRNEPTLSGTVVIALTIQADGNVGRTRVARNTTGDQLLGRCLAGQVATWQLPHPPGGSLELSLPFSR